MNRRDVSTPEKSSSAGERAVFVGAVSYSPMRRALAGVAAWAIPGFGYVVLGQMRRALVVGIAISVLYVIGLLVGGVTVTNPGFEAGSNSQQFLYWFQSCLMPSHLLRMWQEVILSSGSYPGGANSLTPESATWFSPSLGRVREVGVLYLALCGLLNVLAIVDAVLGKGPQVKGAGAKGAAA